ncbi:MAG: T9SS type A sorting domain-containing protein, partial [Bacteroidia bacterium]|nr:T9SS type A sorting domain-containing protein [Bacteroidia bacterium]
YVKNANLGSFYEDKLFFTDYVRDFVNVATFADGTLNWVSDVERFATYEFGDGMIHMSVSPMDGFLYHTNILGGRINRISFVPPYWTSEPVDATVEADGTPDPGNAFINWLNSFAGDGACGTLTVSNDSSGLSDDCGSSGSETVTFTLEDECGNLITKVATFTVQDTTNPTFNEALPGDQTVDCNSVPTAETLTASDTAGIANVVFDESITAGSCTGNYTITRTWTATDACENQTVHVQTITVEDTTDPTFNEALPGDLTVDCNSVPSAETLSATDDCTTAGVAFEESTAAGSCTGNYTITRTWTATDACDNQTMHVQTITVQDTTDPEWTTVPADANISCDEDYETEFQNWVNSFSGTDNCSTATVSDDSEGPILCGESRLVTFSLTDDCGNFIIASATFFVEDTLGLPDSDSSPIRVYPNPSFDHFQISGMRSGGKIEVYNLTGQLILEKRIVNKEIVPFNVAAGLYYLKIFEDNHISIRKLIVE